MLLEIMVFVLAMMGVTMCMATHIPLRRRIWAGTFLAIAILAGLWFWQALQVAIW